MSKVELKCGEILQWNQCPNYDADGKKNIQYGRDSHQSDLGKLWSLDVISNLEPLTQTPFVLSHEFMATVTHTVTVFVQIRSFRTLVQRTILREWYCSML